MLAYIWAQDENGLIGREGKLPWYLPNDLSFFKLNTIDNTIVMGRKTFEGMNGRLLPERQTIVLSRQNIELPEGALLMHTRQEVLDYAQNSEKTTFITGGSELFRLFEKDVDVLYLTEIEEEFEGDTYFDPDFDFSTFKLVEEVPGETDEKNKFAHVFKTFRRKKDWE